VIKAGVHKTSSIKVAEAAKVVENSQRDINIAFMNELAMVFDRMGIDTKEVIDAMNTKWNALGFILVWWVDIALVWIPIILFIRRKSWDITVKLFFPEEKLMMEWVNL